MDLAGYLSLLRRRWLTMVIVGLSTLAMVALVTLVMPTMYTATTRLFFGVQSGESATDLIQGSTFAEKQMKLIRTSRRVAVGPQQRHSEVGLGRDARRTRQVGDRDSADRHRDP